MKNMRYVLCALLPLAVLACGDDGNTSSASSNPPIPKRRAATSGGRNWLENPARDAQVKLENSRTDSIA